MFLLWGCLRFAALLMVLLCAKASLKVPLAMVVLIADTVVVLIQALAYDVSKEKISKLRVGSGLLAAVLVLGTGLVVILKPESLGIKDILIALAVTLVTQVIIYFITSSAMKKASTRSDKTVRKARDAVKTATVVGSAVGAGVGGVAGGVVGGTVTGVSAGLMAGTSEATSMYAEVAEEQKQRLEEKIVDGDYKDVTMANMDRANVEFQNSTTARSDRMNRAFDSVADGSFELAKQKAANMGIPIDDRTDDEIAKDIITFSTPAMLNEIPEKFTDVEKAAYLLGKE